jgi:hypothetical protein
MSSISASKSALLVVLLAACYDSTQQPLTAPNASIRANTSSVTSGGHGTGYSSRIQLCVDASSPAGTYKFRNSSWNSGLALPGYGTQVDGVWYDQGDGGEGYGAAGGAVTWLPAEGDNSEYSVAVGSCVTVMTRTQPSDHYATDLYDDWQAVNMTATSWPSGVSLDHVDCIGDQGVIAPQPSPCGNSSNPTRAFANYDHGVKVTFVFAGLQTAGLPSVHNCTYTQGYYDTHESYTSGVMSGNANTTYVDAAGKLLVGSYALSAAQVDAILGAPAGKGYNVGGVVFTKDQLPMIHQLISAELNIAGGAASASVSATISAANAGYASATKSQVSSWTATLDSFNQGKLGVNHC